MPDEKPPNRPEGSSIPLPKPPAWMTSIPSPDEAPASPPPPPTPVPPPAAVSPEKAEKPAPPPLAKPAAIAEPIPAPPRPAPQPIKPMEAPPPVTKTPAPADDAALIDVLEDDENGDLEDDEAIEEAGEEDTDSDDAVNLLSIDPALAFIVLIVVMGLGLATVAADARFAAVWSGMALIGVGAILANEVPVPRPTLRDLLIGAGYGLLVGLPVLVIGRPQLARLSTEVFEGFGDGMAFMILAFAMPFAETIFFRGAFLAARGLLWTAGASGLWAVLLLVPAMSVSTFPLVTVVISAALVGMNFLYAYIGVNFNLYAAWACQVALNLCLLWLPRLFS